MPVSLRGTEQALSRFRGRHHGSLDRGRPRVVSIPAADGGARWRPTMSDLGPSSRRGHVALVWRDRRRPGTGRRLQREWRPVRRSDRPDPGTVSDLRCRPERRSLGGLRERAGSDQRRTDAARRMDRAPGLREQLRDQPGHEGHGHQRGGRAGRDALLSRRRRRARQRLDLLARLASGDRMLGRPSCEHARVAQAYRRELCQGASRRGRGRLLPFGCRGDACRPTAWP